MSEEKKEIGYFNNTSGGVIFGFNPLYNAMTKPLSDAEDGYINHIENIAGHPREIKLNIKGQMKLDRERRGGKRLWQRIYCEKELLRRYAETGVDLGDNAPKEEKPESTKKASSSKKEETKKDVKKSEGTEANSELKKALGV